MIQFIPMMWVGAEAGHPISRPASDKRVGRFYHLPLWPCLVSVWTQAGSAGYWGFNWVILLMSELSMMLLILVIRLLMILIFVVISTR